MMGWRLSLRLVVSAPRVALSDSQIEPYRTDMVFAKLSAMT